MAIDFRPLQPIDFEPIEEQKKPVPPAAVGKLDFQPIDFQPEQSSPALPQETSPTTPETLKEEDFQRLGQKYSVDPEELRKLAPYYGARITPRSLGEAVGTGARAAAGFAGKSLLFNLPQKVAALSQEEPMRKALDELQEIGRKQETGVETVREILANPIAGFGSKAITRVGSTAGIGAAQGVGESREGEELSGAATGAVIGGSLGLVGEGIGKLATKFKLNNTEKQLLENQAANKQFDLDIGTREIATKNADSENIIRDMIFNPNKTALNSREIDTLLTQQIDEAGLKKILDSSTPEGNLIRRGIDGPVDENRVKQVLAERVLDNRTRDFAEDLIGKRPGSVQEALSEIEEVASRQGVEATQKKYQEFVNLQNASKYIEQSGIRATNEPNFFGRTGNFVSDAQFVLRNIDDKFGTRTEDTLRELNKDYSRSTYALKDFREKYNQVFQKALKEGTDSTVVRTDKIYKALDTGDASQLSPQEISTAGSFREYFNDILKFVNSAVREKDPRIAPLSIPVRENYVPHMLLPTEQLVPVIEKKITSAVDSVSSQLGRKIDDLSEVSAAELTTLISSNREVSDLIRAVTLLDNRAIRSGADLSSRLKEMLYTRNGNVALETKARAAMERQGEIPEFMRETNLYKLARRYTDNTLRHLYLRNGLDSLRYQADALKKAGADVDAQYLKHLIQDVLGVRKGTAAEAMVQAKVELGRKLDKSIDRYGKDSVVGGALTTAKAIPDYMKYWLSQIYDNTLGYLNIRAALQNATAAVTKVAPELGGVYGYKKVLLDGAFHTVRNLPRLIEKARSLGNIPAEFTRKGEEAIAEGVARTAGVRLGKQALEGIGKAGMIIYQKMEDFNRALALGVGEVLARDIARGGESASKAMSRLPHSVRKQIAKDPTNVQYVGDLMGKYLNDTTQYNYNKLSMSEFGRTMGPFFSVFSKWPTATAGDIIYEMRNKGILKSLPRSAEKYIAPFVLLQLVDYAAGERMGDSDSLTDVQKKLLGSGGLSQSAPIGSLGGVLRGEIFSPPIVDTLTGAVSKAAKDDITSVEEIPGKAADIAGSVGNKLFQSFFPGAGLIRLITDDIVTYTTGERPEGSSFLERTIDGTNKLTK